jgi:hypothetical protein
MSRIAVYAGREPRRSKTLGFTLGGTFTAIYIEPRVDPAADKERNLDALRITEEVKDPAERWRLLFNLRNA